MKYYKIIVNEDDDTGIDFNAFVDVPAHLKGFIAFGKEQRLQFNEEKRIVTGVLISVGTQIYRKSQELGEHYVFFDAPTVDIINKKAAKAGYWSNLNLMHDPKQVTKGAYMTERYIVSNSDPKKPNIPEVFANQNLQDGSLIGSYYIEDDKLWQSAKDGTFNGFSVEGIFDKQEVKIKTSINMSKQTKSIWDIFKKEAPKAEKFASATTVDGVVVTFEGELTEGTACFVEIDGEQLPAPEGEHQLTLEDGSIKVVTLDSAGVVVTVTDVEMQDSEAEVTKEDVADAMRSMMSEVNDRFVSIEAVNTSLTEENAKMKLEIESFKMADKFGANPKIVDEPSKKVTIAEMVKNAKK